MKKLLKRLSLLTMAALLLFGCVAFTACHEDEPVVEEPKGAWEYAMFDYTNAEGAAAQLEYGLYIPASYTAGQKLPLITYIPDASYVGQAAKNITKAAGPTNWATEEKMKENPAFILVFGFTETSSELTEGTQGAQIVPVINKVVAEYGMDEDRLYLTGQSMGGITDFALNDAYPDLFAATVYVGCQPGSDPYDDMYNELMANASFVNQKFIYIISGLDQKAPFGWADVKDVLDDEGIEYGLLADIDHNDMSAANTAIKAVLDQGYEQNFFAFKQLTANGDGVAEHMQSFKYSYQIDALFDWLMAQHK